MLFVLVVHMKVVMEPNIVNDCIMAFLDDLQLHEYIKDPPLTQIKRITSSNIQ